MRSNNDIEKLNSLIIHFNNVICEFTDKYNCLFSTGYTYEYKNAITNTIVHTLNINPFISFGNLHMNNNCDNNINTFIKSIENYILKNKKIVHLENSEIQKHLNHSDIVSVNSIEYKNYSNNIERIFIPIVSLFFD